MMVLLTAACSGQAPKTEQEEKAPITTARDVALEKLEWAEGVKDSLENELQIVINEEAEAAAFVMENATKLADDAPEVLLLNQIRMHLDSLKKQLGLVDGQVRFLKRELKIEE